VTTAIEWVRNTDGTQGETWNPVTGCTKVSEGCDTVVLHPDRLGRPLRRRKPTTYFVNSMSDLFHDDVPDVFIADVFAVMAIAERHTFQILTKRPGRMASIVRSRRFYELVTNAVVQSKNRLLGEWPVSNVWLGTSVENQKWADVRIPKLLQTPAAVRFLSCEPLLGPIDLTRWIGGHGAKDDANVIARGGSPTRPTARRGQGDRDSGSEAGCSEAEPERPDCEGQDSGSHHQGDREGGGDHQRPRGADSMEKPGIDWVIVGGESGPGARPMHPDWARSLRDQCVTAGVSFFFKQWGGRTPKAGGRELDGRTWDEMPERGA